MIVSHEIKNIKSLGKKLLALEKAGKLGAVKAVQESVFLIHSTAINLIQENTDGPAQQRYAPRRTVHVSPPGTPPNTDTGRLVQSIKFDFKSGGLIGRVGTNLRYGAWLEFGTATMAARPWLAPAVLAAAKGGEAVAFFKKAIKDEIFRLTGRG